LEVFRKSLSRSVAAVWDPATASAGLAIDAYVSLGELSLGLVDELERLAPFGRGNPPLQLATRDLRVDEDTVIGRDGEHRRLVVADEHGTQQTVLWWQSAHETLPEGRFDLAYELRARDYRGERQLQIVWVDARSREEVTTSSRPLARVVIDRRAEAEPREALANLSETGLIVWAEGEDLSTPEGMTGTDRLGLTESPVLVIWTTPAGPDELAQAMLAANPDRIHVFAVEPLTVGLRGFLERLAGMVKYDLRARGGHVDVRRLAAALGHREATVRAGLDLMAARGHLRISKRDKDTLTVYAGTEPLADSEHAEAQLQRLLDETAAYRRHFRSAPTKVLGIS
jgi:single-stranded-DNA-specific exonuclease